MGDVEGISLWSLGRHYEDGGQADQAAYVYAQYVTLCKTEQVRECGRWRERARERGRLREWVRERGEVRERSHGYCIWCIWRFCPVDGISG